MFVVPLALILCAIGLSLRSRFAPQGQSDTRTLVSMGPVPLNSPQYSNWRLVADSDFVVVGQLVVPTDSIRASLSSRKYSYVKLQLKVDKTLKGTHVTKPMEIKFPTEPVPYDPSPYKLLELHGRKVIAFLSVATDINEVGTVSSAEIFFGQTPRSLQPYDADVVRALSQEIENQKRIVNYFPTSVQARPDALHSQVQDLIETALHKETQAEAFAKLEGLGPAAVPSLIRLLDDRRPLPVPQMSISLRSPNLSEGITGPRVMVDALSIILSQLSNESFGAIYNGGSELQRARVVSAYRVYLHYRTSGALK